MNKFKVVIIGGNSKFGQWWKNYFESKGQEVIVVSRSSDIPVEEAVKIGDIIIFSVTIRNTKDLIKMTIPNIPAGKLVMDFTGIKIQAATELIEYKNGEVVTVHPMFGPWIKSLENQNIAFDPIYPGEKWEFIHNLWKEDNANLIQMNFKKHDELVAIVQSTVHFVNLLLGHILQKRGIDINEMMKIGTPNSRMQMMILSRFLNQEASLYTDMQMFNTVYINEILPEIKNYTNYLEDIIEHTKTIDFEDQFNISKNHIGQEFLDKSLNITSKVDDLLKSLLN